MHSLQFSIEHFMHFVLSSSGKNNPLSQIISSFIYVIFVLFVPFILYVLFVLYVLFILYILFLIFLLYEYN